MGPLGRRLSADTREIQTIRKLTLKPNVDWSLLYSFQSLSDSEMFEMFGTNLSLWIWRFGKCCSLNCRLTKLLLKVCVAVTLDNSRKPFQRRVKPWRVTREVQCCTQEDQLINFNQCVTAGVASIWLPVGGALGTCPRPIFSRSTLPWLTRLLPKPASQPAGQSAKLFWLSF